MRVAWTGHRPEFFAVADQARDTVFRETDALIAEFGTDLLVLSGGQLGVDLWAAIAARGRRIPLRLLLPCPLACFSRDWSVEDVSDLSAAVSWAHEVVVFADAASDSAGYDARNRALASECDLLIAVWTGMSPGGTSYTIEEARAQKKPIREHRLAPSSRRPQPGQRGV